MRLLLLIGLSLVVGGALGATIAYREVGPTHDVGVALPSGEGDAGPRLATPEFHIDAYTYDFGTMERGSELSHTFTVTNTGMQPLHISVGSTSCKCTVGKVDDKPVLPGESVPVTLTWTANSPPGPFRQTTTLHTSDPRSSRVELSVEGQVTVAAGLEPQEWYFGTLQAGEERTQSIYLMSFHRDSFNIERAEIENPDSRERFEVSFHPVPPAELPDQTAKSGYRLDLTTRGGIPPGSLSDWVVVESDLAGVDGPPGKGELEKRRIPILGTVVGDISLHGRGWNDQTHRLYIGMVEQKKGAEAKLLLSVKGEHAEGIEVELIDTFPAPLEVEIEHPQQVREGVAHVRLTVRIPPGSPPALHLGTEQGQPGEVRLRTNHPQIPEFSFEVQYGVRP